VVHHSSGRKSGLAFSAPHAVPHLCGIPESCRQTQQSPGPLAPAAATHPETQTGCVQWHCCLAQAWGRPRGSCRPSGEAAVMQGAHPHSALGSTDGQGGQAQRVSGSSGCAPVRKPRVPPGAGGAGAGRPLPPDTANEVARTGLAAGSSTGVSVAQASASAAGTGSMAAPCEALTGGGGGGGGGGGAPPAAGKQGGEEERRRSFAGLIRRRGQDSGGAQPRRR
jgi:hypothetical protein